MTPSTRISILARDGSPLIDSTTFTHDHRIVTVWRTIKCYMAMRPRSVVDALRLYSTFPIFVAFRLIDRRRFQSLGYYIPGRSLLTVCFLGILAHVRPGTNDIAVLASTTEPQTAEWFQVRTGDIVLDIGAHIGRYSLLAARQASRVIAVEPEPSNFEMLRSNIKLNGFSNIIALRVAMSSRPGHVRMYLGERGNLGTWSTNPNLSTPNLKIDKTKSFEIECDTLDNVVDPLRLEIVDWLKIDAEGHELSVLNGARETLTKTRRIILEVAEANQAECKAFVRHAGFRIVAVEKGGGPTENWLLEHL